MTEPSGLVYLGCMKKSLFESVPCSRCAGTGHYSYCSMYGTRCFKCSGRTWTLTKRGAVAQALYTASLSRRADQLQTGDVIYNEPGPLNRGGWVTVESVGPYDLMPGYVAVQCSAKSGKKEDGVTFLEPPSSVHRVSHPEPAKAAVLAFALAYQENLTKNGTLRKRASKTEAAVEQVRGAR